MKCLPLNSLVITIGESNDAKLTFLEAKFPAYEIINANDIRIELVGDPARYDINSQVYGEIRRRIQTKLALGERVVVDAGNYRREDRISLAHLGTVIGAPVFYLIHPSMSDEGFQLAERDIMRGDGIVEVIDARLTDFIAIQKLPNDLVAEIKQRGYQGITVIGDVHGMYNSFLTAVSWAKARHHFLIFLGDIVDYGRQTLEVANEVYRLAMWGEAELLIGNHERKIARWIEQYENGSVTIALNQGNKVTVDAILALSPNERKRWINRFKSLLAHSRHHRRLVNVLCVHAGVHASLWETDARRLTKEAENLALFGEIDKSKPSSEGYPIRSYGWCETIADGQTAIVGHDVRSIQRPMVQRNSVGGTVVFLDTGSGKSGNLSSADIKFQEQGVRIECYNLH